MSSLPHFAAALSDVGRIRGHNEDSFVEQTLPDGHLLLVADGMGGHEGGEVASGMVAEVVLDYFRDNPEQTPRERLGAGIALAHAEVCAAADDGGPRGMGSTAVACFIQGNTVHVGHVGDSRLYWLRAGAVRWVTEDHTQVRQLVAMGVIDEDEARGHPQSNIVTRAVGHVASGESFQVDIAQPPLTVQAGDSLVLCSDGLSDLVADAELTKMVADRSAEEGAALLVNTANERGGHDNITVIVVHFGEDLGARGAQEPDEVPTERAVPVVGHGRRLLGVLVALLALTCAGLALAALFLGGP